MEIVTLGPDDWQLLKSVRLQALRDAQAALLSSVDSVMSSRSGWPLVTAAVG